ncbi:heme-binding protein [Methylobacterium mesophilicum SR1.6/6]|uniref:Heme-binding protein n=1 Tax=Methylobacterium mesophilicum SR1.6/6 TaxID=908290 RepID=A0A6B9FLE1_9HYPH|nr:heme-binding protein [Methylobacterium mesophilicum]QGY01945.1 heme-binding protein [Methylobacterium mesophilicum SR1.6/6]
MDKITYILVTLLESVLGIFGIRGLYEQPAYTVIQRLDRGVEIRAYAPRLAVETDARGQGDGAAFGRLFRYITGANQAGSRIAMTVPVEQGAAGTMRFFLPRAVAEAGPPEPTEAGVRLVQVPAERVAALRFSGRVTPEVRAEQEASLARALAAAGLRTREAPMFMGYDPPFALPFLRRNEVAARLESP